MHSVNSKTGVNLKTGVNSKMRRVLAADPMLGMLLLAGMSSLIKTLSTRIRLLAIRVCGRGCFSGIGIYRCSKRNSNDCGLAGLRFL